MELMEKLGYKQTEVGLIPEDWEVISIDDAIKSTQLGGNYQNSESENDYPLMKMGNLDRGFFKFNKIEFVVGQKPSKRDLLKYGDVIFNTRNTLDLVGKVAVWKNELDKAYFNSNLLRFEFDENKISSSFFFNYLINTKRNISQLRAIATGTTSVAAIYSRDLTKVLIAKPTLTEQKAIATALSDVDDLIANLDKLITKKKAIKQGAMQQLLTPPQKGGKRLSGFTGEWTEIRLDDLIHDFQNGYAFSAIGYEDHGIRIITMAQIGLEGQFQLNESKGNYWDASQLQPLKDFVLKKGDLIMSMTDVTPQKNLIGRMTIIEDEGPFFLNQRVGHLRVNKEKANTVILKHLSNMRSWRTYSKGIASLGVQANIGTTDIKNGTFNLPQIEEQNAIAQILSDMDTEIKQLATKKVKYQAIKQGMMQELLTGKSRLV
jgi:type I restriction enzyme, S subunit